MENEILEQVEETEPILEDIEEEVPAPVPEKRKYKVKVDQEELEVDEDELVKDYQLRKASQKRFDEAAQLRKQLAQEESDLKRFYAAFQQNPIGTLQQLGLDMDSIIDDHVLNNFRHSQMSPEEKRALELEQELQRYKAIEEEALKRQQAEQQAYLQAQAEKELEENLMTAIAKRGFNATGKVSVALLTDVANHMLADLHTTGNARSPDEYLDLVESKYHMGLSSYLDELPVEKLMTMISKSVIKKIRDYQISNVKGSLKAKTFESANKIPEQKLPEVKSESPKSGMTIEDYIKSLEKKAKK